MTGLLSCPAEITIRVLSHCHGFPDVLALASTCKQLYSLWESAAPIVIQTVGKRCIFAFDDALMAVRATSIVTPALSGGRIPPDIGPIAELSATSRTPSISELMQVLNMQHLVRCLEHMFFFSEVQNGMSQWTSLLQPRPPRLVLRVSQEGEGQAACADAMARWKENFRRATYRLFLAGAALAHAYNEPLFRLAEVNHGGFPEPPTRDSLQRDQNYLKKVSTAYDYESDDEKEAATFEPLSSWIVEAAKKEACRRHFVAYWRRPSFLAEMPEEEDEDSSEDEVPDPLSDTDVFAVWEMMRMVVAHELTRIRFARRTEPPSAEKEWLPGLQPDQTRKVSVVMFGDFQLDEITMPARLEDAEGVLLIANRITSLDKIKQTESSSSGGGLPQSYVPQRLLRAPLSPGRSPRFPSLTLQYKFFTYTFRVRWNKRFTDLDAEWANAPYQEFIGKGQAFAEGNHSEENYGLDFLHSC